jgi:hypothetical protein
VRLQLTSAEQSSWELKGGGLYCDSLWSPYVIGSYLQTVTTVVEELEVYCGLKIRENHFLKLEAAGSSVTVLND